MYDEDVHCLRRMDSSDLLDLNMDAYNGMDAVADAFTSMGTDAFTSMGTDAIADVDADVNAYMKNDDADLDDDDIDALVTMLRNEVGATSDVCSPSAVNVPRTLAVRPIVLKAYPAKKNRGERRKQEAKRRIKRLAPHHTTSPPIQLLDEVLVRPPVSSAFAAAEEVFTRDEREAQAQMKAIEDASAHRSVRCNEVQVSTMTLAIKLGAGAVDDFPDAIDALSASYGLNKREALEAALLQPAVMALSEKIFAAPLAVTEEQKAALRTQKKNGTTNYPPIIQAKGVFANCVIAMTSGRTEEDNNKSCKIFTNGTLHITGCKTIDAGAKFAGAIGQVVRKALGLSDIGPHPVASFDVQMINTDFTLTTYIDRLTFANIVNRGPPGPSKCVAIIPSSKHSSVKLSSIPGTQDIRAVGDTVAGKQRDGSTVLVFSTGSIMMTGFKSWKALAVAHAYTVNIITDNSDAIYPSVMPASAGKLRRNRKKFSLIDSPIMKVLPPRSFTDAV